MTDEKIKKNRPTTLKNN